MKRAPPCGLNLNHNLTLNRSVPTCRDRIARFQRASLSATSDPYWCQFVSIRGCDPKPNKTERKCQGPMQTSSPFPSTLGPRRSTCGWAPSRLLYKTGKTGRFAKPKKLTRCTPVTCDAHLAPRPIFNPLEPSPCLCAFVVSARIPPLLASLELPGIGKKPEFSGMPILRRSPARFRTFSPAAVLPGPENAATKGAGTGLISMGPRALALGEPETHY